MPWHAHEVLRTVPRMPSRAMRQVLVRPAHFFVTLSMAHDCSKDSRRGLHSGSSRQFSATRWQPGGGWYPFEVCGMRPSGGCWAHLGWTFSCANMHESCRLDVFLQAINS